MARSGAAIHIALLNVEGEGARSLPRRSLDCAMDNLLEVVRSSLRRGDIVSRCSISQYILMLPNANYENSCKVCQRIIRTFSVSSPILLRGFTLLCSLWNPIFKHLPQNTRPPLLQERRSCFF